MDKNSFNLTAGLARIVKLVMVVILAPVALGLVLGILRQLEMISLSGGTFRDWLEAGVLTYVGLHLLLYRPVGVFRFGHRIFSVLAVWLFGGQVATVDNAEGNSKRGKGSTRPIVPEPPTEGSTLVAFSPYVIPLYTVLVCASGWALRQWFERSLVDGPVTFLVGVSIAFHWVMTADDLQQQRSRWHLETYLLAMGLVFVMTLLVASACLHWAVPEFSFVQALSDGLHNAQGMYGWLVQNVFF